MYNNKGRLECCNEKKEAWNKLMYNKKNKVRMLQRKRRSEGWNKAA